jgi:predicted ATPase
VDQPEENLDNQSVFKVLVPCVKSAKSRRQVFIVTHNPNLAVGCDAEQIIWASLEKSAGSAVVYRSGSIESSDINPALVDVLEGTWPAFSDRQSKYRPN